MSGMLGVMQAVLAQGGDQEAAAGIMAALAGMWLMLMLAALGAFAFMLYCWWRIFEKAGFGGPFAFLFLVPGIGPLIVILVLAFGDWPALRKTS